MLIINIRLHSPDYDVYFTVKWICTLYSQTQPPPHTFPLPLPYRRYDVPLMCHTEMRTAGWEAGCTLGAHEARQDQAAERKETFLCIHEYHSSRRDTRTKTSEVNGFSLSSSATLGLLQVQNTEGGKHILLSVWLVSENKFRSKLCVLKQQNQDVLCGCQRLFKHFLQLEISHFFVQLTPIHSHVPAGT